MVWNIFYFPIYLESSSQFTNIFQRGSNHQLGKEQNTFSFCQCKCRCSGCFAIFRRCEIPLLVDDYFVDYMTKQYIGDYFIHNPITWVWQCHKPPMWEWLKNQLSMVIFLGDGLFLLYPQKRGFIAPSTISPHQVAAIFATALIGQRVDSKVFSWQEVTGKLSLSAVILTQVLVLYPAYFYIMNSILVFFPFLFAGFGFRNFFCCFFFKKLNDLF